MKRSDKLTIPVSLPDARQICEAALQSQNWAVQEKSDSQLLAVLKRLWQGDLDCLITLKEQKRGIGVKVEVDNRVESADWGDPFGILSGPLQNLCEAIAELTDKHLAGGEEIAAPEPPLTRPTGKPIFISYATEDHDFAHKLAKDLRAARYEVWIFTADLRAGAKWLEKLAEAIEKSQAVVVVVTPDAFRSDWVDREIQFADEMKVPIFPVLHKASEFPKWFLLRFGRIQRADFTRGAYRANFTKLTAAVAELLR